MVLYSHSNQCRDRASFFTVTLLDVDVLISALTTIGAVSLPLLQESARQALHQEAEQSTFRPEVKILGSGDRIVQTEYAACETFPQTSLYLDLTESFQALLHESIAQAGLHLFDLPLQFNSKVLQRYEPGQLGITPHRDSLKAINLICLFNISGQARFCCCADRSGTGSIAIDTTPGHVIFLRAPGFLGSSDRPFHYVSEIQSKRYSFGLRQRI
jgi:hypothetical protein